MGTFDLKNPCKRCPFRTDDHAIRFANRERAEEIEEGAYRTGFPCHVSAETHEYDNGESSGYVFGPKTQHCVGYIIMQLKAGYDTWPGINNDDALADRLSKQVNFKAPVFEDADAFFAANTPRRERG